MKTLLTWMLLPMVIVYIFIIEEILWDYSVRFLGWISSLPVFRQIENWISKRKGGWAVATLLILPGLSIWPIKILALYLMGHGHPLEGAILFLAVKIVATALFARLYTVLEAECKTVSWFSAIVTKVMIWKSWIHIQPMYQYLRGQLKELRAKMSTKKGIIQTRWLAIRRHIKSKKMIGGAHRLLRHQQKETPVRKNWGFDIHYILFIIIIGLIVLNN